MPEAIPTREIFLHLSTWMEIVFYAVAAIASGIFLYGSYRRIQKYRRGRKDDRFDNLPRRISRALIKIVTNSTVRRGDRFGGFAHTIIFWGFVVLFIGTVLVAVDHDFLRFFSIKMLQGTFYLWFSLILDIFGVLFIIGLIMMIVRRAWFKLPELNYARPDAQDGKVDRSGFVTDDMIFVWLLLAIAVTGYLIEGFRIAESMPEFERWSPVGWMLASLTNSVLGADRLVSAHVWSWWSHALLVMFFIAYIPFSKMMHIFTDTANLIFHNEHTGRRLPGLPPGPKPNEEGKKASPAMGYTHITDFTWKELLDFDACTKCGRCHVVCPANAAGTTLSPRDLILDLRTYANEALGTPEWLQQKFQAGSKWPLPALGVGGDRTSSHNIDVADQVVRPETLWSCTTCMACMEVCPVGIEHLSSIVQMRRHLVDAGTFDDNLQNALMSLGDYGNSFGESPKKRSRWTKGLKFKIKDARKEEVDILWFVGDFASYDPRIQVLSRMVAQVFHDAEVDFGILHDGERNAGNDVRRVGEEGLFEMLAEDNIKVLEKAKFKRIVTTDPHTLNTLRNEYPELGASYEVLHYTNLLVELIEQGKLQVKGTQNTKVTFHDPCYLARYNGETESPRTIMNAIGLELLEMPRCGKNTFCCGAGGGRIWMDTSNEQKRTSEQRIEEALSVGGVEVFVTVCPKDYAMYTDAVKSLGKEREIAVKDLIELVAAAATAQSNEEQ